MKKMFSIVAVVLAASILAGCAGNSVLNEVPSINRILSEAPTL